MRNSVSNTPSATSPPNRVERAEHHYVPKFYLKGFTDNKGVLWVYEKSKAARASKPKAEANRENYYSFSDLGPADDRVEKALSKAESVVAPLFCKLGNRQFRMKDEQRSELFTFVAMMFVRVPAFREFLDQQFSELLKRSMQAQAKDADKFYRSLKQYEAATGHKLEDPEKLREFALSAEYTVEQTSAGYNLKMAFETGLLMSEILDRQYNYDVWYAPAGSFFMTCDNPIATLRPSNRRTAWIGVGIGWPDTEVLLPLNKRACLNLRRGARGEQVEISARRTQQINNGIMAVAQRYLYAPESRRRISRMFEEFGCKIRYGENALMPGAITQ